MDFKSLEKVYMYFVCLSVCPFQEKGGEKKGIALFIKVQEGRQVFFFLNKKKKLLCLNDFELLFIIIIIIFQNNIRLIS